MNGQRQTARTARSATPRGASSRFLTRAGSVVLTERSPALPVVGVGVSLRRGTLHDPPGQDGLTVLTARAL